jgi:hypothetical protein
VPSCSSGRVAANAPLEEAEVALSYGRAVVITKVPREHVLVLFVVVVVFMI